MNIKTPRARRKKVGANNKEEIIARLRGDLLTMAGRISHDLRTPLNYIFTASEAMKEILLEKEPAAAHMAASLLNSAEEITQLLKRVSFLLRASADPAEKTMLSMASPATIAAQRLELQTRRKQATIRQPASWPEVAGVAPWLEVIWWNLIMNALSHGGEKVRIELGWEKRGEQFRFWVSDSGPGVAEDRRKTLFKPFDSLHETKDFAGLGLAIVRRLVELQGGNCGYESPPTGGSIFYFELPDEKTPKKRDS